MDIRAFSYVTEQPLSGAEACGHGAVRACATTDPGADW